MMVHKLMALVALAVLLAVTPAYAAPITYYFVGEVSSISDGAGAAATAGVAVGDSVLYQFIVDTASTGSITDNAGNITSNPNHAWSATGHFELDPDDDDATTNDFSQQVGFVDYQAGSLLNAVDGGFFNEPDDVASHNYATSVLHTDWLTGEDRGGGSFITGGSENNLIVISHSSRRVTGEWEPSLSGFIGKETAYDAEGNRTTVTSTLTQVPEPASLALLGLGGLVMLRRQR